MPIEINTVYDKERILAFNDFIAKSKAGYWVFMGVCSVIVLVCMGLCAALDALNMNLILLTALMLFIDILYVFVYVAVPRITLKKNKNVGTCVKYTFRDDCFTIEAENPNVQESSTVKYAAIQRVRQGGGDIYLFMSKLQAYIVDTSALSEPELEALKALLKNNIDSKKIKM